MPIRIYALAKKLNIDSKLLVEQCAKAGVSGKGSALASLTDEETAKVQEYLSKSKSPATPVGATSSAAAARVDRRGRAIFHPRRLHWSGRCFR